MLLPAALISTASNPLVLERLGGRNGIGHDQAYLFARQIPGHGRGELPRRVLLRAAEHDAHAGYLIAHVGALFVDGVGDALEGDLVHGLGARVGEMLVFVGAVLHPHQVDPALREAAVIGDDLVFVALGVGARSRFHHAVRQFERAYLDAREQGGEIGGVSPVVVALRIELRRGLPDLGGQVRLGCARRSFLIRRRLLLRGASGQHPSRQKATCGGCGGSGQKASSRQAGSYVGHVSPSFLACLPSFFRPVPRPGRFADDHRPKGGPAPWPKGSILRGRGSPKGLRPHVMPDRRRATQGLPCGRPKACDNPDDPKKASGQARPPLPVGSRRSMSSSRVPTPILE